MPRRPRLATGGYVFPVLNRAVARAASFTDPADYPAGRGPCTKAGSSRSPSRRMNTCWRSTATASGMRCARAWSSARRTGAGRASASGWQGAATCWPRAGAVAGGVGRVGEPAGDRSRTGRAAAVGGTREPLRGRGLAGVRGRAAGATEAVAPARPAEERRSAHRCPDALLMRKTTPNPGSPPVHPRFTRFIPGRGAVRSGRW
jgi:hypothetical protein